MRRSTVIAVLGVFAAVAAQAAYASSIVSTSDVKVISFGVNDRGQAMVTYTQGGQRHHTLAYGAENAIAPKKGHKQVNFTFDYSGGYTLFKDQIVAAVDQLRADQHAFRAAHADAARQGKRYTPDVLEWSAGIRKDNAVIQRLHKQVNDFPKSFACKPYTGPKLAFAVAACDAPDGSYWAVQAWQRLLPMRGFDPWTALQSSYGFNVSHWSGPLAQLDVTQNWTYSGSWTALDGRLTYDGQPVYG